jgi:hypothetical protein
MKRNLGDYEMKRTDWVNEQRCAAGQGAFIKSGFAGTI